MPDDASVEAPLVELLRKCHRDELLPLAHSLGVRSERMGRGTLAAAIDGRLRRSATHELANAFLRRGAGVSYTEVLRILARRHGLDVDTSDHEAAEDGLLRAVLADRWQDLSAEEKSERWHAAGEDDPVPDSGQAAVDRLADLHGARYPLTARTILLARFLPGPLGCLPALIALAPRLEHTEAAVLEVARLRKAVRYRVTVGIVGSPSSGKDAAMHAVFGIDTGNIDPVAGSTKAVEIVQLPHAEALYLVNTPGLGDVVEGVTEAARQILDHIDVYLYVINAQGGVQAREKADHQRLLDTGRPVLSVINKIDTLRDEDRERYLADARGKLGVEEEDFAAVAFDPLPQLAPAPIGIERVQRWIETHLTDLGKELDELPWRQGADAPAPSDDPAAP